MYYKLICILYALLCGQNFILVKSGCYIYYALLRPERFNRQVTVDRLDVACCVKILGVRILPLL
jgi:hypothetical protein